MKTQKYCCHLLMLIEMCYFNDADTPPSAFKKQTKMLPCLFKSLRIKSAVHMCCALTWLPLIFSPVFLGLALVPLIILSQDIWSVSMTLLFNPCYLVYYISILWIPCCFLLFIQQRNDLQLYFLVFVKWSNNVCICKTYFLHLAI